MQFKLASVLAVASVAMAATTSSLNATLTSTTSIDVASGCSFSKTHTVTDQAGLDDLAGCEAIKGDLYITGSLGTASIANVKAIYGDLTVSNATSLTSFSADSIGSITGVFTLESLTILSSLSMGSLSNVGALNWVTLPALLETGLSQVTECNSIYISDTELSSLSGLNPVNVEEFDVNNNNNLVTIDSDIETVSKALSVSHNGDNTEVSFPDLKWANNLTFYSVSSVSLPSLTAVNSSAGFFECTMKKLDFSNVTAIGGDLTIENNDDLKEADFSSATSVGGGLTIENNTKLDSIDGFDSLKSVTGAVSLKGDFDKCSLPALKTVRGAFDVDTTGEFDCSDFSKLADAGNIRGDFQCKAATESSSAAGKSTEESTSTEGGSSADESTATGSASSSSKDGASNVEASVFGALAALLLAVI